MTAATGAVGRRRGWLRWSLSLAATAASTYVLELIATGAGVLAAGLSTWAHPSHTVLLLALGTSYLLWALGLRTNLRANHTLLERTGTSTNVLSKAAYDLAVRRTHSRRVRHAAGAVGYLLTELAKEIPYYAGAFGLSLVSDSVSADAAVAFLAGANLGAAAYEYILGRVTRALLDRRSYAAFETDWVPQQYLADYYSRVEPDERETIAFLVDAIRRATPGQPLLLFGVGPTLHHVFLAAEVASELHLGDYLPANLAEIRRWVDRDPGAHDWRPFVRYTLQCEGMSDPTDEDVTRREELTRARITRLVAVDGRIRPESPERYATVLSAYCADSATSDKAEWSVFMANIIDRVQPDGLFLTAALRRCRGYAVGDRTFPSADVDERDLRRVLEGAAWGRLTGSVQVRHLGDETGHGYSGIMLAWARRGG